MVDGTDQSTLENILAEGKKEFLQKGFKDASLRNIVKQAGVTTGAFYGYFPDKSALFHTLVSPAAEGLKEQYINAHRDFSALSAEQKFSQFNTYSDEPLRHMMAYLYENLEAFKLIICRSDGTDYASFIDSLVDIEADKTQEFIKEVKGAGYHINEVKPELIHILSSSFFYGIFEVIIHDMPKDDAEEFITDITAFHRAGWDKIFGFSD